MTMAAEPLMHTHGTQGFHGTPVEKHWVRGLDKLYEFRLGRLNALATLTFWIFCESFEFFCFCIAFYPDFPQTNNVRERKKTFLFMKGCQLVKKKFCT
jgi:hypothetical protein